MISPTMSDAEVQALYEQMSRYYSRAWAKMHRAQQLYDHQFPFLAKQVPQGVDIHEPSTASSIIDHFRDNIRVHSIVPSRDDWGTTKKAREQKALLLRLDNYVLKQLRKAGQVDLFVQTVFDMALRGAACVKLKFDQHAWPEMPDGLTDDEQHEFKLARSTRWPLPAEPIDPLDVMPAPGGGWPIPWLVHKRTFTCWEAKQAFEGWTNPQGKKATEPVIWIELWSSDYHSDSSDSWVSGIHKVVVDGQMVLDEPNPFVSVPYAFEYSGMGRLDWTNDPATLAVNMLEKAESELIAEARLKTSMDAAWQFTVFPRLLTTDDPRDLKIRWDLSSGGILQVSGLGADQKPQWLEQPQLDAAMWNFLPIIQGSIERATFSSAMEGQRQPGVDYGYLQALLIGQASLRKDNIIGMASKLFARLVGLTERAIVALKLEPISLGPGSQSEKSRRVLAEDIGDRFDLDVTIEASDPAERDRKMIAWLTPLRARAISKRTYLKEGLMLDDPDEELAAIYAETVIEQLMASGLLVQQLMADLQADTQAETLEQAAALQFRNVQRTAEGATDRGLVPSPQAEVAETRYPGQPPGEESPVSPSPLAVVNKLQSANRQATGLSRQA